MGEEVAGLWGRDEGVTNPEMVTCNTIHQNFPSLSPQ